MTTTTPAIGFAQSVSAAQKERGQARLPDFELISLGFLSGQERLST
jgi:hypothetical protein